MIHEIAISNTSNLRGTLSTGGSVFIPMPSLPEQAELIDKLSRCFFEIQKYLKSDPPHLHLNTESYFPWGEASPRMRGEKTVTRGASLDVERCYPENKTTGDHALREKLHLRQACFEWLPNALTPELFSFFKRIFSEVTQSMNCFEETSFGKSYERKYEFQLLLIRYTQCTPEYNPAIHQMGSSSFGNIHEDETLFSFHLAESVKELKVFDYELQDWKKSSPADHNAQLLLGQHARMHGFCPTPHQLEATNDVKNSERFSFIMEKVPLESPSVPNPQFRPEFIRFLSSDVREKLTAIVIWDQFFDGSHSSLEAIDLTEDLVRLHLYFFIKGDAQKVVRFDSSKKIFSHLESLGFKYVLCVRPGFLVKCESVAEELLQLALIHTEKYFIHHYHRHLREGVSLCILGNNHGSTVDRWIQSRGINAALFELPNDHIDNLTRPIHSQNLHLEKKEKVDWPILIQKERDEIEKHLKDGFSSTFLFNTEGYQDVSRLAVKENSLHAIGFASGFKLNYLCHLQKSKISHVTFVDSNANSIQLKKDLISTWDGTDFPSWFENYWQGRFPVYEKDPHFLKSRWQRELDLWGGETSFQNHWAWFRQLKISFIEMDIIRDIDQLIERMNPDQPIAFWASNLWHNEFVSYSFGEAHIGDAYLEWLKKLDVALETVYLIQDDVPHHGQWISPNNRTSREILKKPIIR